MWCNVCYDTNQLKVHQTKQVASLETCKRMTRSITKIVVMPRMKWSKCKSPDTSQRNFLDFVEDSLKKWHMVNIIRGEKHVLFKVQFRYFSWVCEKSFTDCGRESYITEFTILSIDFAKMSDCMKCSCPWESSENIQRGRTGQGTDMQISTETNEQTKLSVNKTLDSTINTILGGAVGRIG